MTRLLVVGGTGFIGRHLCRVARNRGHEVTSFSLHPPKNPQDRVTYLTGNLTDRHSLKRLLFRNPIEYVVNCGGYIDHRSFCAGGRDLIAAHFEGVQNLVENVDRAHLKRFVNIGSSDEYGSVLAPQREDMRESPISPYSLAKVVATHFLQMLWLTEQFPAVTLRLFLTYGPGQDMNRFLPQLVCSCLRGDTFPVSAGKQLRDFCYVDDVVAGIWKTFDIEAANGLVINLASGNAVTIRETIDSVCNHIGSGHPVFGALPYRPGENMALWADISKARDILGWSPRTSFAEGLATTIAYFRRKECRQTNHSSAF